VLEVTGVALAMVSVALKYWQPAAPLRKKHNIPLKKNNNFEFVTNTEKAGFQ